MTKALIVINLVLVMGGLITYALLQLLPAVFQRRSVPHPAGGCSTAKLDLVSNRAPECVNRFCKSCDAEPGAGGQWGCIRLITNQARERIAAQRAQCSMEVTR